MMHTIKEVAAEFKVTTMAVRHWIKTKNIPYEYERVIGSKPRIILDIDDVYSMLNLKKGDA